MSDKKKISLGNLLNSGLLTSGGNDYNEIVVPKPLLDSRIGEKPLHPTEIAKISNHKEKISQSKAFNEAKYSGLKLFKYDYEELPKLIDPIFPKVGVVSLVGSSDTGKSTFLRQLVEKTVKLTT